MRHLLVTNDFPPKVGGIQSYLWELWRRLPPESFTVLTTPYHGDRDWDRLQPFEVRRAKQWWLLPTTKMVRQINNVARNVGADLVVLDPVVPLGLVGPKLDLPYVAIAHGAEYVIPGKLPFSSMAVSRVTRNSAGMIASGAYVEQHVRAMLPKNSTKPVLSIPPGVDHQRFVPLSRGQKRALRERYGVAEDAQLVVGISRLVPRKGFDRLIKAAAILRTTHPKLQVLIAGKGREYKRLAQLAARLDAPVRLLGRVEDSELPGLYGVADVFCMPCHDRWFGLEREGFGIVFCEASATATPVIAGHSGGSGEAVVHRETGLVIPGAVAADDVAGALATLLANDAGREEMGWRGRKRVVDEFSYDHLAAELGAFLGRLPVR